MESMETAGAVLDVVSKHRPRFTAEMVAEALRLVARKLPSAQHGHHLVLRWVEDCGGFLCSHCGAEVCGRRDACFGCDSCEFDLCCPCLWEYLKSAQPCI